MTISNKKKNGPIILLIVDGWGIALSGEGNALAKADMSNFKELVSRYPSTILTPAPPKKSAKKKIDVAKNYSLLGTGKLNPKKDSVSLFDIFDKSGINWLVITEAEKFAYSTYFFSGGKKIKKDNYLLISSETTDDYSLEPEKTSLKISETLLKKIKSGKYDFILANFSNLDMVAHSGNFSATVKMAETIDQLLKSLVKTVLENSGILVITSSHGNAEEAMEMKTETNNKKDTANPVPFLVIGREFEGKTFGFEEAPGSDLALVAPSGSLADVLPTILKIMELEIPNNLNGQTLF